MTQSSSPPPRGRFRFLYQFSLRTLLLATAAVSVFCNWYFQPKYHEEELAGKELRLRRQVKTAAPQSDFSTSISGPINLPTTDLNILNHGNWSLLDGDELTLVRGRFHENAATGKWIAWYPTGGKAAEGKMQHGVKVGRWRTWYEDGTLASDIRFSDQPVKLTDFERGPPAADLSSVRLAPNRPIVASRHGAARSWRASGKLKHEGSFVSNQQDGVWTFYDEQGRVTESGPFRAGLRHGEWTRTPTRSASEGVAKTESVRYVDGRTEAELNEILAGLKPLLSGDDRAQRYAALIDLADLGEGAVPLLLERLTNGDAAEQAAIVGMIPRMPTGASRMLPRVRELLASGDERLAHPARLTLFQLDPESREEHFALLFAEAKDAATLGLCLEELTVLYCHSEAHRGEVFTALMELPLLRNDADVEEVADATADLGGNVTPFVLAACGHKQPEVKLQAIHTIQTLTPKWIMRNSYLQFREADWQALLEQLQSDPAPQVSQAAKELELRFVADGGSGPPF